MNWSNVRLIFLREIRDQLRDRRTVFTIAILPILLYPLLGISVLQIAQFRKEHPTRVWFIGEENLDVLETEREGLNQLLMIGSRDTGSKEAAEARFNDKYCPPEEAKLIELDTSTELDEQLQDVLGQLIESTPEAQDYDPVAQDELREIIQDSLQERGFDALVYVTTASSTDEDDADVTEVRPELIVMANSASDKSFIASQRVDRVLDRYRRSLVETTLRDKDISPADTEPFKLTAKDIAAEDSKRAAVWSKILPFVMLIWALTGAFYPAIDLCAGEKERGTLETLLSSPAKRVEIVGGKLLTIMAFSMSTAILNLASMGLTGTLFIGQIGAMGLESGSLTIGPPPIISMGWLVLAMLPASGLFSALSLAIAAFARSSKEGQYYLMPLLMITLPLMLLPILPAAELDLGTALIPVTGMMLLLRALIEGQYAEALRFVFPVLAVTLGCCLFALRWAVDQFNNESVLFRESERLGVTTWFRHMVRDRGNLPTVPEAILCGFVILVIRFFANLSAEMPGNWNDFVTYTVIGLVAFVATPALVMAIMLTRCPAQSLMLRLPRAERKADRIAWWSMLPGAALLAIALHPAITYLSKVVISLYPVNDEVVALDGFLQQLLDQAPSFWAIIGVFALAPAICEELAFRGFILSGLFSSGHKWRAILISAAFFGAAHGVLQQSIVAGFTGLLLGYIAVQTRSILPCMIYHLTHNSVPFLMRTLDTTTLQELPWLNWLLQVEVGSQGSEVVTYTPFGSISLVLVGVAILLGLSRMRMQYVGETNAATDSSAAIPMDDGNSHAEYIDRDHRPREVSPRTRETA